MKAVMFHAQKTATILVPLCDVETSFAVNLDLSKVRM